MRGGSGDYKILNILKSKPIFETFLTNYERAFLETKTLIKQCLDSEYMDKAGKRQILMENLGMKSGHAIQFLNSYIPPEGVPAAGSGALAPGYQPSPEAGSGALAPGYQPSPEAGSGALAPGFPQPQPLAQAQAFPH